MTVCIVVFKYLHLHSIKACYIYRHSIFWEGNQRNRLDVIKVKMTYKSIHILNISKQHILCIKNSMTSQKVNLYLQNDTHYNIYAHNTKWPKIS